MIECKAENCDYYKMYGECSSACLERGIKKIITNYDRIRNMSIEELAEYIYDRDEELSGEICRHYMPCPYGEDCKSENCKDCIKKWLESEATEE